MTSRTRSRSGADAAQHRWLLRLAAATAVVAVATIFQPPAAAGNQWGSARVWQSLPEVAGQSAAVVAQTVAHAARQSPEPRSRVVDATSVGQLSPGHRRLLDQIRAADTGQLAVSEEDGRFLRVLVSAARATRVLEIGGASGYSTIWIGLGLRETGGRMVTIEYDAQRARQLAANVERAGLADIVRVVRGDGFAEIPKLSGTFDLVFLDAWKRDYARFFRLVLPRLDPGGLFVAHNVVNKKNEMADFLWAIEHTPGVVSSIVAPSGEGLSITYKAGGRR